MMSGITPAGQLFTLIRPHALRAEESAAFLRHLQRRLAQRLLVIWDRSPIHRGQPVKAFLSAGAAPTVHLEPLPPYAPDLNPDEGVWKLFKQDQLANVCCQGLDLLHQELRLATVRLRHNPDSIQACFGAAGLEL